jgi:hypothetical protein
MHFVKDATYVAGYTLLLTFEDGSAKLVDLEPHLDGEIFEPLKVLGVFRAFHVNRDLDTITWDNGADFSPDFLYEIGRPAKAAIRAAG